jgi:hypothetical protein
MTYQHDFFISYSRRYPVGNWVRNHFCPELREWLDCYAAASARIFIDQDNEEGDHWPTRLQAALAHSKYLIAVWSPQYFTSPWCCAEWRSMRQREDLLGLRRGPKPTGLIYPVVFSDGRNFPVEARETQSVDFSELNYPMPEFKFTPKYIEFVDRIKSTCGTLAAWLDEREAPVFDQAWPIARPAPHTLPVAQLPRIQ